MKHRIGITVAILLLALWFTSANPSTIDAGFVQTGVTGTIQDSFTFVQVMVPRDLPFACTSSEASAKTCIVLGELVDLNLPSVDAVFIARQMVITRNGKIIFDYRKPNPRQ